MSEFGDERWPSPPPTRRGADADAPPGARSVFDAEPQPGSRSVFDTPQQPGAGPGGSPHVRPPGQFPPGQVDDMPATTVMPEVDPAGYGASPYGPGQGYGQPHGYAAPPQQPPPHQPGPMQGRSGQQAARRPAPASGQRRQGGQQRSAPPGLHMPWIGVLVAGAGVVLLWMATQSMDWIDSASGAVTLSELGRASDLVNEFGVIQWYADWGWKLLVAYVVMTAVLATLVNFTSSGLRTLLWLPLVGPFALFNLTDRKGTAAPRVLGVLAMLAPAALLGVVWVNLLVDPDLDVAGLTPGQVEQLQGIDPDDPSTFPDDPEALPDPEVLAQLDDLQDVGPTDLAALEGVGFDWRGFSNDEIGNGLWMSFGGVGLVAVGAVVGTRAAR